jgi:hypothetical protein
MIASCLNCGGPFEKNPRQPAHKFCSPACRMEWHNNPESAGKLERQMRATFERYAPAAIEARLAVLVRQVNDLQARLSRLESRGDIR